MQILNINHLISQDQTQQASTWATDLCQSLFQLKLPANFGVYTIVSDTQHVVLQLTQTALQVLEFQDGKIRQFQIDWSQREFLVNTRRAQKDDLEPLLLTLKLFILSGKKTQFVTYNAKDIEIKQAVALSTSATGLPPALSIHPALGVLAAIGKTIHTISTRERSQIATFIDKSKTLLLSIKNGFKKIVINNRDERPKPTLKYQLDIATESGTYNERSHFVSNRVHIDFESLAITINDQPITETGCTWFSDKLGNLAQDLAGGRADIFE